MSEKSLKNRESMAKRCKFSPTREENECELMELEQEGGEKSTDLSDFRPRRLYSNPIPIPISIQSIKVIRIF